MGSTLRADRSGGVLRHPQRHALPVHHQRRMHVQPQRPRRALVLADQAQPHAARMLREIQVRAVLDAQHRGLPLHPLQRALPVRGQDVLRPHLRVRRLWSGDDLVDGGDCVIGRVVFD